MYMPSDLTTLFYPASVAVIGASRSPEKLGSIILKNILKSGYKGKVYPVNPHAKEINGLKVYKEVQEITETPELIIVAVPAEIVVQEIEQAGEKGVKNAVVLSAGFKEIGDAGEKLEKKLTAAAKKYDINLLGPNCLGFVNMLSPINATFGEPIRESGNLRFITQSGAIAASLFDWCNSNDVGISEFVTLGNKAGLNENDILHYFYQQSQNSLTDFNGEGLSKVQPIGLYLESIANGGEFLKIASEITKTNPLFIIKPGKTKAAVRAMQSHTGAIAGEDSVLKAVLEQAGVIRCATLEDFFDLARAFAWEEAPEGPKVAVVSNAGGPAVISADAVVGEGLELAEFDDETKSKLSEKLPRSASIINPVDILGDALADRFTDALEIIMQNKEVNALVIILTPQIMTQIEKTAETIGELAKKYQKTVFCSFIGGSLISEGETILNRYKIPSFRYPERAIAALGEMWKFKQRLEKEEKPQTTESIQLENGSNDVREIIQRAINEKERVLDNISTDRILRSVGINTPPTKIAGSKEEAKQFAEENGWPIVLKLSSPGLLHKKEVGGVITNITDENALSDAWHKMERKTEQLDDKLKKKVQFQVQKDIVEGIEVIVGFKHDPTFGAVLLFGAGGSYAELIADRNLHLLPINKDEIKDLVSRSKIYRILQGDKGQPAYALEKLYDLILRMSKLEMMVQEAEEIEINPVIVTLNDTWAVDGKVVLKEIKEKPTPKGPQLKMATCTMHKVLATQFNYFELETDEPFQFKPGQYISVKVAPDAIRAYSIATHDGPNKIYLLVDTRPGGPGSKFFENLKPGDRVPFLGPFGVFTLNLEDDADEILLLATGSGMSALRCILDAALTEQNVKKPIKLYFGLTYQKEIFWKDHFEELKKKYSNFDYKIVVCEPGESWGGCTGFITKYVKEDYPDASRVAAYLCGHRAMIADATDLLMEAGCPKERIYQERFI
jgi:acetyltransferase